MPKARNNDISEEPPLLIKGRGIPTTGRRPTTIDKLIIKLAAKVNVNPPITNLQNLSLALRAKYRHLIKIKKYSPNNKNTPSALKAMVSDKSKALFERQGILNARELESRYEVLLENYINKIGIEADLFQEMSRTYVLPSANKSINRLSDTYNNLKGMGLNDQAKYLVDQVTSITYLCEKLNKDLLLLKESVAKANGLSELPKIAKAYAESVTPYFEKVRTSIDMLEGMVDNDDWKLPKYRELLFIR